MKKSDLIKEIGQLKANIKEKDGRISDLHDGMQLLYTLYHNRPRHIGTQHDYRAFIKKLGKLDNLVEDVMRIANVKPK